MNLKVIKSFLLSLVMTAGYQAFGQPTEPPPSSMDAALAHPNGNIYFFNENRYQRYIVNGGVKATGAMNIEGWRGVRFNVIDAALVHPDGYAYFFHPAGRYVHFDFRANSAGKSSLIFMDDFGGGWRGLWNAVDDDRPGQLWRIQAVTTLGSSPRISTSATTSGNTELTSPVPSAWMAGKGYGQIWLGVAAVNHPDGSVHFFKGDEFKRYNFSQHKVDFTGKIGVDGWKGVKNDVTAGLLHPDGTAYFFFQGPESVMYQRYAFPAAVDWTSTIGGTGWTGLNLPKIDASVEHNGIAYFFRMGKYTAYDLQRRAISASGSIGDDWKGLWTDGRSVDAAIKHPDGQHVYFIRGQEYKRFDLRDDRVDADGKIGEGAWIGLWKDGIDAAVLHPNGYGYFFRNDEYKQYDFSQGRVTQTKHINRDGWRGAWPSKPKFVR